MKNVNLIIGASTMKGVIKTLICAIYLLAMSQSLMAQTIQFNGGSCVLDSIVEVSGIGARADFTYTLDENAEIEVLRVLLDKGQLVANRKIYKATGIIFDNDEQGKISTKRIGTVSLNFLISDKVKIKSLRFELNKQETPIAKQSAKEAIIYAESIAFIDSEIPSENVCYIIPGNISILSIDNLPAGKSTRYPFVITSGTHNLHVRWANRAGWSYANSIRFDFEEGKCYNIGFDHESNKFFVGLATDTEKLRQAQDAMAVYKANINTQKIKRDEYLAFQRANPNHLDGVWSGEKKRLMNTFFINYTISGEKIVYEGKNKHTGMKAFIAEGRLLYNENIIIMFPEKATANGKEVENFNSEPKYIWYYTLTDGVLHIEGGRTFNKGGWIWENTGKFSKIN